MSGLGREIPATVTATFFSDGSDGGPTGEYRWRAFVSPPIEGASPPIEGASPPLGGASGPCPLPGGGPLVRAKPERHSKTKVIYKLSGKREMRGCVCLCLEPSVPDIDRVVKLAAMSGASSCLVAAEPSGPTPVPVVVLGDEQMSKVTSCRFVEVRFEPGEDAPAALGGAAPPVGTEDREEGDGGCGPSGDPEEVEGPSAGPEMEAPECPPTKSFPIKEEGVEPASPAEADRKHSPFDDSPLEAVGGIEVVADKGILPDEGTCGALPGRNHSASTPADKTCSPSSIRMERRLQPLQDGSSGGEPVKEPSTLPCALSSSKPGQELLDTHPLQDAPKPDDPMGSEPLKEPSRPPQDAPKPDDPKRSEPLKEPASLPDALSSPETGQQLIDHRPPQDAPKPDNPDGANSSKANQELDRQPRPEAQAQENRTFASAVKSTVKGAVKGMTRTFVSNSIVQADLEQLLSQGGGWTDEESSRFQTYKNAIDIYKTAASLPDDWDRRYELSTISRIIQDFLKVQRSQVDLLFLAFSALLCNNLKRLYPWLHDARNLKTSILACIGNYDPRQFDGPKLMNLNVMRGSFSPCANLASFLNGAVESAKSDRRLLGDTVLSRILWILLYHCEARPRLSDWSELRALASRSFFASQRNVLEVFLDEPELQSLGLSIQGTLEDFCMVCLAFVQDTAHKDKSEKVLVVASKIAWTLVGLIKAETSKACSNDSLVRTYGSWKLLIDVLAHLQFDQKDIACRRRIIGTSVEQLSFRECDTFAHVDYVLSSVRVDHKDYGLFRELCFTSICQDLEYRRYRSSPAYVEMGDFAALLKLPIGKLLANEKGVEAVSGYATNAMQDKADFKERLKFLAGLHRSFVADEWAPAPDSFEAGVVRACFSDLMLRGNPLPIMLRAFEVAAEDPSVFALSDPTKDNSLMGWLAKKIVSNQAASDAIRRPQVLGGLKLSHKGIVPGSLMGYLLRELMEALKCQCKDVGQAAELYSLVCKRGKGASSELADIADHVLVNSFLEWNPQTLCDLLSVGVDTFLKVYGCLVDQDRGESAAPKKDCVGSLKGVIFGWHQRFYSNEVTLSEIKNVLSFYHPSTWEIMDRIADIELPQKDSLGRKVTEFAKLKGSIRSSLSMMHEDGNGSTFIQAVLQGYNAITESGSQLSQSMGEYEWMFQKPQPLSSESCTNGRITLLVMWRDAEVTTSFRRDHEEELRIADFFLRSPSILFRDALGFGTWQVLLADSFFERVKEAKRKLIALFQDSSEFKAVKDVVKLIGLSDGSLEEETQILSGFFNIAEDKREQFMISVQLCEMSLPLQRFVNCCTQFQFGFVGSDRAFSELSLIAVDLSNDKALGWSAKQCVGVAKRICHLLCPKRVNEGASLSDVREALTHRLPILQLLSELSLCSDVWTLAREMKWFGEDGRKRFFDDYDNVTHVLLGSLSFEMSVLNSLEPSIRYISSIGGLADVTTMQEFLDSVCCSTAIGSGAFHDLHVVQQNVSNIREWFTTGLDDLAAVFGLFESVCRTGFYNICDGHPARLCLCYQKDANVNGSIGAAATLEGDDLIAFVQQLGFIQHESETVSQRVNQFIDQHQTLAKAVAILVLMGEVGFEGVDLHSFSYKLSDKGLYDAEELLKDCHERSMQCDDWLAKMRRENRLSLLFWMEELKEMHMWLVEIESIGLGTVAGRTLLDKLVCVISRVVPYDKRRLVYDAAKSTAASFHDDMKTCVKSWLMAISNFVESLHAALGSPRAIVGSGAKSSQIVIHTLNCDEKKNAVCLLLKQIYSDRLPEPFEVLDGLSICSSQKVLVFLERVLNFPSNTFAILNTEELSGEDQEKILSFMSRRDISSRGIHLHCIQGRNTILHSSPWVEGRLWDNPSINTLAINANSWFKERILDQVHVDQVTIVSSSACGTGKTRHVRDELERLQAGGDTIQVGSVSIHEGTSLTSLVSALSSKFPCPSQRSAIHFSFTCMSPKDKAESEWMEIVNQLFFSLLVLRSVHDPDSASSFHLGQSNWRIFVELQTVPCSGGEPTLTTSEWLRCCIPILLCCGSILAPPADFIIDADTRRVCTYLRAYDNGTIDRKFCSQKAVVFLLDESGSMEIEIDGERNALDVATDNALQIFDNHIQVEDMISLITFDTRFQVRVPLQQVSDVGHKQRLRTQISKARHGHWGGTNMYTALHAALSSIEQTRHVGAGNCETWIICLTDGESSDRKEIIRDKVRCSSNTLHLIVIGVNLDYELHQPMQDLCNKFRPANDRRTKGFFIPTAANADAMNKAFQQVASKIKVSDTFELDGELSDQECRDFMKKYLPQFIASDDMLRQTFWIQYLHRRVKVFDNNHDFNFNETYDDLGSSLMMMMLFEVEQFLREDQHRSWIGKNHHQLLYDFTIKDAPVFRLICTSPELMDAETRDRYERLDLPGFFIPTSQDLRTRAALDRFLSQALKIPLSESEDGSKKLQCIDDNSFILTLDFTMKLLSIHERVSCRIPCILEGETGVSKTALTKMYTILMNSSLRSDASASTLTHLEAMVVQLNRRGVSFESSGSAHDRLQHALAAAAESTMEDTTDVARQIFELLQSACASRSCIFQDPPSKYTTDTEGRTKVVSDFLSWFSRSEVEATFFEINVDASLTERDVRRHFEDIRSAAQKLSDSDALVVVFLDEVNTSSVLGLFKEIIIDHSICGDALEDNIVIVAACNPARGQMTVKSISRENDLGKEWAKGHYQVAALPGSMAKLKWAYGSLDSEQEKEFIYRRIESMGKFPPQLSRSLTELVSASQEAIRSFAAEHFLQGLEARDSAAEQDARERARSTVSLRDIQRAFSLFHFFSHDFPITCTTSSSDKRRYHHAMLLTISVVYYLRLDHDGRSKFIRTIESLPTESTGETLEQVLNAAMDNVIRETEVPSGIALTRGLKENTFMTLVCSLSRTPLMIVGPPGSSKTLSVNIISDNANGEESPSPFYRSYARLSILHYQCSKASTSKEVATFFEKAIQKQDKVDSSKHICVVFFDEAGLPEEDKESLKVLHYYLEGHMSTKSEVGFVAITNHILDAAKSNRCAMLLRQEPDQKELLSIASGVLFDATVDGHYSARQVECHNKRWDPNEFASILCRSYTYLLHHKGHFKWFECFFGLRDFIYFLKKVRTTSATADMIMVISLKGLVWAFERNFNGKDPTHLEELAVHFLGPMVSQDKKSAIEIIIPLLSHPMDTVRDAITEVNSGLTGKSRFKLIIDESEDDSIMRLLSSDGILDLSKSSSLFKLSGMPEGAEVEKSRLVSAVKYSALQGNTAVLSQTDPINESFYDLFNQNFRSLKNRDGEISLYAMIAVGGISRRSLVRPSFQCILHVRKSELEELPAPLLNRFEKYRLTIQDVLDSGWRRMGGMREVLQNVMARVEEVRSLLGEGGIFGWVKGQTLNSIFVDMLPRAGGGANNNQELEYAPPKACSSFVDHIMEFISTSTSLTVTKEDVYSVVDVAKRYLLIEDADVLAHVVDEGNDLNQESVKTALCSIISGKLRTPIARVACAIVQMLLTRIAVFRLLMLATPESVFAQRHCLPQDVIQEFFLQEHFSLKSLISRTLSLPRSSEIQNLFIVYTRTDAFVHGLPTIPVDEQVNQEKIAIVRDLVHFDADQVIIEHLLLLKNEASVRSVVESWAAHACKHLFVLIVDMSDQHSINRVNFVRSVVEQNLPELQEKLFVMLLHYPPSSSHCKSCYPALFLGGWQHVFLDGIGHSGQSLDSAKWIGAACRHSGVGDVNTELGTRSTVSALLPRALAFAASQNLFYSNQVHSSDHQEQTVFSERYDMLMALMERTLGEASSVGDILCEKFLQLWTDRTLLKTLNRASNGLLNGTTQLSMSLSLQSVFQDTLGIFITTVIAEMNNWRNLDILSNSHCSTVTDELFGRILRALPVPPFEELILHRRTKGGVQAIPSLAAKHGPSSIQFPFFYFVSSFLDNLVESAEGSFSKSPFNEPDSQASDADVLKYTMHLLDTTQSDNGCVVKDIVESVTKSENMTCGGLFRRYLSQFVQWKLGCEPKSFLLQWISGKASKIDGAAGNILSIHIIARRHKIELLRLSSWSGFGTDETLCVIPNANAVVTADEMELLQTLLQHFETSLAESLELSPKWSSSFSTFLRATQMILADGKGIGSPAIITKLRFLILLHLLATANAPPEVMKDAIQHCYGSEEKSFELVDEYASSLEKFVGFLDDLKNGEEVDWYCHFIELMFRRFFSPHWRPIMRDEDLVFLLGFIAEGNLSRTRLAVALLRDVCIGDSMACSVRAKLSNTTVQLISSHIQCKNLLSFSADGKRTSVPHFVPQWLIGEGGQGDLEVETPTELASFFVEYGHGFSCPLSNVMFDVILSICLQQAQTASSEELLLSLMQDIEVECSVDQDHMLSSRMESSSVHGSAVGAMIADAQLLCFVVKVAHELALASHASALTGPYAELGHSVLLSVMSLNGYRWQDFFFGTIIRVRGEGNLFALLSESGPLHDIPWCKLWVRGLPDSQKGSEQALKDAEDKLAEALREEEKKCQELRRCPNCGRLFSVLERNCGGFVCGRDAHGNIGNDGVYGCGSNFNVDHAPRYTVDDTILMPLRARVAEEQAHLRQCNSGAMQFERAKGMQIPFLSFTLQNPGHDAPLVPTSALFGMAGTVGDLHPSSRSPDTLIKVLAEERGNIELYSFLPDFVELYMWLHSTFRFLVTREQAMEMNVSEIMDDSVLIHRFDRITTNHILKSWSRTVEGFNSYLRRSNSQVFWECDEVQIPFQRVVDASLMMFLSEADHPTDGHDYLFLVINDIIQRYNSFSRRLGECSAQLNVASAVDGENKELHPKYLLRGSVGAIAVSAIGINSIANLSSLVESFWCIERSQFDLDALVEYVLEEIGSLSNRPAISNPVSFLRERFHFRDDSPQCMSNVNDSQAAIRSSEGDFFVHVQDLQLFEDVKQGLQQLNVVTGDAEIRRAIGVNFHDSDYDHLRSILEGTRTIIGLLSPDAIGKSGTFGDVMLHVLQSSTKEEASNDNDGCIMGKLGFPTLKNAQADFIKSLGSNQLYELVMFLGFQLASEAYLFATLPLCMTDPLSEGISQDLRSQFEQICMEDGVQRAVNHLDEFVTDILSFYEAQIREASATSQSLKAFLQGSNFCDSDCCPFFAILPADITTHNYVSLRQQLHQLKLAALYNHGENNAEKEIEENVPKNPDLYPSFTKPMRGRCWLWTDGELQKISCTEDIEMEDVENSLGASGCEELWFEMAPKKGSTALSDDGSSMSIDTLDDQGQEIAEGKRKHRKRKAVSELDEVTAATLVQSWWRIQKPKMKHNNADKVTVAPFQADSLAEYGGSRSIEIMKEWLNDHKLPKSLCDHLVSLGARSVDDVALLVKSYPDILGGIAPLDEIKLKNAVKDA